MLGGLKPVEVVGDLCPESDANADCSNDPELCGPWSSGGWFSATVLPVKAGLSLFFRLKSHPSSKQRWKNAEMWLLLRLANSPWDADEHKTTRLTRSSLQHLSL